MKPHPRPPIIRKTIKWGGAVLTVLLVVVWVASGWISVGWYERTGQGFRIVGGVVRVFFNWPHSNEVEILTSDAPIPGWFMDRVSYDMRWRYTHSSFRYEHRVGIPLWMATTPIAAGAAFAWLLDSRARRRQRLGKCPKCGYDRTGIAGDAKCPECGAMPVGVCAS